MTWPARFLVATWDGGGNAEPAFHLGSRLARRGHRVRMIGWQSMAARAAAAGIEFTPYRSVPPWPAGLTLDDGWQDRAEPLLHGAAVRDEIVAQARSFGAGVLVVDCMLGAGFAAAAALELPTAVLVHVLYSEFANGWGDQMMHTSVVDLLAPAGQVLALTPPGFDTPTDVPSNTEYVGPICRPAPARRPGAGPGDGLDMLAAPGDPWVLLSLSTTLQRQAGALPRLLEGVAALPVRVLLTLGGVIPPGEVNVPPGVTVRAFVPHDVVLPHMAAVICHAGLSTITSSLAAGVPLVCVPQGRDQPLNAARVEASGAGRALPPDASPARVAQVVASVLRDRAARAAASGFAAAISALGAGQYAAERIEGLATGQGTAARPLDR
jgi:UDP:flavonoid glycosyltransferase YjiC (YdhE family)